MKRIKMEPEGILPQDDDIIALLQQQSSHLEVDPNYSLEYIANGDDGENEGILVQNMDIQEPLSTLKSLLEQRLAIDLSDYSFWLQDAQMLENHKNLVDQCVQGEGLVQVNVQIKHHQQRINIVDVLKPAEDYIESAENVIENMPESIPENTSENVQENITENVQENIHESIPDVKSPESANHSSVDSNKEDEDKSVRRWVIDSQFQRDQERLKIPADPMDWSQLHVRHWLQWAVRRLKITSIKLADWNITGSELCNLSREEFHAKVPIDPGDIFWTHFELLRKCKFVAVVQKDDEESKDENIAEDPEDLPKAPKISKPRPVLCQSQTRIVGLPSKNLDSPTAIASSTAGRSTSGQIQLWQFLLELLTDKEYKSAIQWVGSDGEFKLNQPEVVAQLWGACKNKPSMNYEKLSRALRYYYDGDMISKVPGKRFVYKFVCDLKQLLGYSAAELSRLVNS